MKLSNYPSLPSCNCGNHLAGTSGDICEICMGYICSPDPSQEGTGSCFDTSYFEALEASQNGLEYAA